MKCKCFTTVLEKVAGKIKPNHVKDFKAGWRDELFDLKGGRKTVVLYVEASYYQTKKDGAKYKNRTTKEIGVSLSYCPFCGEKMDKGETP